MFSRRKHAVSTGKLHLVAFACALETIRKCPAGPTPSRIVNTHIVTGNNTIILQPERILRWVKAKLTDANVPRTRYIITAALIATTPVLTIVSLAVLLGQFHLDTHQLVPNWRLGNPLLTGIMGVMDVLFLTPLVETGLMLVPIWGLRKIRVPEHVIPVVCALLWGVLHTNYHGSWIGLLAAWPFYCFTVVLLFFEKPSLDRAWLIASAVHSVSNLLGLGCSFALVWFFRTDAIHQYFWP